MFYTIAEVDVAVTFLEKNNNIEPHYLHTIYVFFLALLNSFINSLNHFGCWSSWYQVGCVGW